MTVRTLASGERSRIIPFVEAYSFKPYRNYRVFPRSAQNAVMLAEIDETLNHSDGAVVHVEHEGDEALVVARALAWDTAFFGVPMGRIEHLLGTDRSACSRALKLALEALVCKGIRHVGARVDVADIPRLTVFEDNGFRVMDSLVTYTTRPRKEPPHDVRQVGTIRPFRPEDAPALLEITAEAYKGFRGRFHLDPHIPDERCDGFYREWARQTIEGKMADMVLVSEGADGRLLGFLAFRRREPVSSVGKVPVFGGGLGACRMDTPGAYAGLIRAGTVWAHEHDGVAECQTQNYNFSTVRIYEAVGAHYVRAEYTLHRWLG